MVRKIVYLFGAGATHAELLAINPDLEDKDGLLIKHVSNRVMQKAAASSAFTKGIELVSGKGGSLNIELFISLIENSRVRDAARRTATLKRLVQNDIKGILTESKHRKFHLHRGLLELHQHPRTQDNERLTGLISLNYDDVLDRAYAKIHGSEPDYCFSAGRASNAIPLLKLHGSFNWQQKLILARRRTIDIIPLGASKSYIHSPYGSIWNRALAAIADCDSLRVIGSSLSPNDLHLIDLLFKAQLERPTAFDIEIIADDDTGDNVKHNYGFFGESIKKLSDLGVSNSTTGPNNPFRAWLLHWADKLIGPDEIPKTTYLKKLLH